MPLHYVRDDRTRRFTVTLTGEVTLDDFVEFVSTMIEGGFWEFSVLYDATDPLVRLTSLDKVDMEIWRELTEELGSARGPVAFVITDERQRRIAERYAGAATAARMFEAAVFTDASAAAAWLDARRPGASA